MLRSQRTSDDWLLIYNQAQSLIATMPSLTDEEGDRIIDSPDTHLWLGRVFALIRSCGETMDKMELMTASKDLDSYLTAPSAEMKIRDLLYRTLALSEMRSPPSARGAFIPVDKPFDSYVAISKIFYEAQKNLFIIDPYLDGTIVTEFLPGCPDNITIHLLADAGSVKSSLLPAVLRWNQQYLDTKPISLRFSAARRLHDRVIFVDDARCWSITQSFKDFAKRSPASITKVEGDMLEMKLTSYREEWGAAEIAA